MVYDLPTQSLNWVLRFQRFIPIDTCFLCEIGEAFRIVGRVYRPQTTRNAGHETTP